MDNKLKETGLVKKISVPGTLLSLPIGEPVLIPTAKIKTASIRTAKTRLEKARKARFVVSTDGLINETKVIRLMWKLWKTCYNLQFQREQSELNRETPELIGIYHKNVFAGNVMDQYTTVQGSYNWVSVWTVPFMMAVVILIGLLHSSGKAGKFRKYQD